jgi:S1-C subfamily serine protease
MKRAPLTALGCALAAAASAAAAQPAQISPEALYDRLAPSIVMVGRFDGKGKLTGVGSGVVTGPGEVVTNCHVLRKASSVQIKSGNATYEAKLRYPDVSRDLCQLEVKELNAPAVEIASLSEVRVGQKVYALGNPRGLERTFSDGLVSALRTAKDEPMIQTTAPVSPGSSGGGLFDARGRLIGITTLALREAQNLNFAVPAEWIRELPERGQAALAAYQGQSPAAVAAAPAGAAAAAPSAVPKRPRPGPVFEVGGSAERPEIRSGDRWKYEVTDRYTNVKTGVTVDVVAVTNDRIQTKSSRDQVAGLDSATAGGIVDIWDRNWNQVRSGETDFDPSYPAILFPLQPGKTWTSSFTIGRGTRGQVRHQLTVQVTRWERITVPAGTFDAIRIALRGRFEVHSPEISGGGTINDVIWYAPQVGQVVRKDLDRRVVGAPHRGAEDLMRHELLEQWRLIEYRPN